MDSKTFMPQNGGYYMDRIIAETAKLTDNERDTDETEAIWKSLYNYRLMWAAKTGYYPQQGRALLLSPTGEALAVSPINGESFTLRELQSLVRGLIEYVPINRSCTLSVHGPILNINPDTYELMVNEEGSFPEDRKINQIASKIARTTIYGYAVLMPISERQLEAEVEEDDEE